MTPNAQDFAEIYQDIFSEELSPFDPLLWEQSRDNTHQQTLLKPDPHLPSGYPEGYSTGPNTLQPLSPTPFAENSVSSTNKRPKLTASSEASNQRKFRRTKKKSVDMTLSLREQTRTNPFAIASQNLEAVLRPYGTIQDTDLLSLWSFPQQQEFACQLTMNLEGASFSGSLLMPKLKDNFIPAAVAKVLQPLGSVAYPATYHWDSFTCHVHSQVSLTTIVGKSVAKLTFYTTEQIQVPIIGSEGMAILHLAYCPRLWSIVNPFNDIIPVGRIPIRSSFTP